MNLVVRFPDTLRRERSYSAHIVFDVQLGVEHDVVFENRGDVLVHVVGDPQHAMELPDELFGVAEAGWPRTAVRPRLPVWLQPGAAVGGSTEPPFSPHRFPADVFGTTFWYVTRMEEVISPQRDEHARFPANASDDIHQFPCVDELIDAFGRHLRTLWPALQLRAHRFSLAPTHDVDRPFKHLFQSPERLFRGMAHDVLRRGDIKGALRAPWLRSAVQGGRIELDPFNTFDWLMDLSERNGLQSTFYFLCADGKGGIDGDYRIEDPRVRLLLRRVRDRGHSIGLHGSYHSATSAQRLAAEIQALRAACEREGISLERIKLRQHVLRFDPDLTIGAWAAAGVDEDSTLGHASRAGFRCGTARPFPLFDLRSRSLTCVIERPLIAMDASLLEPRYEGLSAQRALDRMVDLQRRCRRVGGTFVFLWHNCRLEDAANRMLYSRILSAADQALPATVGA
jgi:hypothetical protein